MTIRQFFSAVPKLNPIRGFHWIRKKEASNTIYSTRFYISNIFTGSIRLKIFSRIFRVSQKRSIEAFITLHQLQLVMKKIQT